MKDPARLKPIAHGTRRGYKQHRYRGEDACAECLAAQREVSREKSRAQRRYLTEAEWQARRAERGRDE